jgi:hypothetical protein
MGSLLSAVSGKLSTSVLLGTFFPVTVFVFLARVLWVPMLPGGTPQWLTPLAGLDEPWEIVILTLVVLVLTGLLYNLNIPLIRLFEGYPWEDTWIGRRKAARYQAEWEALAAQSQGLTLLSEELTAYGEVLQALDPYDSRIAQTAAWSAAAKARRGGVLREIFNDFPKGSSVLPTRLGNVIRSFENYTERQYGMAAITLWPRLVAVLEPSYAEVIDSAKTSVDFMLNSTFLSTLLATLLLGTGLIWPTPFHSWGDAVPWLARILVLLGLAWWLYQQSIGSAYEWGNLVRGAFDLYRGDLLEKLGYEQKPGSADEERKLWRAISSRLVAGDPPPGRGKLPPYAVKSSPPTACRCASDVVLRLARGVIPPLLGRSLRVVLEIRHPDPQKPAADKIVLVDTVPPGYEYRWGSAEASAGTVTVDGTNPYTFRLSGSLAPGDSRQITYEIVPRAAGGES